MNRLLISISLLLVLLAFTGCQSHYAENRKAFENPGGMWMPHQLTEQVDTLKSLGVNRSSALTDPLAYPLGAIVWLGGCSASFVSSDGLIVTNHHCAHASLQFLSTPECNLYDDGFLARSRKEELPAETGKKVWVTQAMIDVTETIRAGLADIADPLDRYEAIESRIKALIAENEKDDDTIRCSVKEYFMGQQYFLIKQLEIRDIRLVYTPKESVGNFGGFVDNWQWPRHACDFTFYRAYVAPDGSPAEYSPDNVPYRPKHYLRIANEPLKKHDFVMVAGYPGRTQRWYTAEQMRFTYEQDSPNRIRVLKEVGDVYESLAAQSEDLRIKVAPSIMGVTNYRQLLEFTQDNIRQYDLVAKKDAQQAALVDWVQAKSQRRQQWADVLDEIDILNQTFQQTAYRDYLVECVAQYVPLVNSVHTIVRMAEERPKPDSERDSEFQQRNWDRMIQAQQRAQQSYDPAIVKAVLRFYLAKINELPKADKDYIFEHFDPMRTFAAQTDESEQAIPDFFTEALTVDDADVRVDLFKNASLEDLQASVDPVIQFVLNLRPLTKTIEDAQHMYEGHMALLGPQYVDARKAFYDRPLAPDANGTLRVTYGTVRGYRPSPEAAVYEPFTTVTELVAKHTGEKPFDAPQELLDAARGGPYPPPYWSKEIDNVPVDFLADLDITGGNSGSATLNSKGQLVGLAFDGNSESVASNLLFMPDITRSIHVDIRYVLWLMKYVDHADNLLKELKIKIDVDSAYKPWVSDPIRWRMLTRPPRPAQK